MAENVVPEPKVTKTDLKLAISMLTAAENAKKVADSAYSQAKTAFEEAVRQYQTDHDCYHKDIVVPMGNGFVTVRSEPDFTAYVHEAI